MSGYRRINEQQQTRGCKLQAANPQTTLKWIYDQALRELLSSSVTGRRDHQPQLDYQLEVAKEPGAPVNLNTPLSDIEDRDFKLVRCDGKPFHEIDDATTAAEGAVGGDGDGGSGGRNPATRTRSQQLIEDENERLRDQFDMFSIEAPIYQEFTLKALPKFGAAVDICLGVSGTKVDMNLTVAKRSNHKPWSWQPKATSIPIETVADIISIKASRKLKDDDVVDGESVVTGFTGHTSFDFYSYFLVSNLLVFRVSKTFSLILSSLIP